MASLYNCMRGMPQHLLFFTGVALALLGAILVSSSVVAQGSGCPDAQLVYPFWSYCGGQPAVYGDAFYIVSPRSWDGLVSEFDETNQTYYMRLTGSSGDLGTLYTLLPPAEDPSLLLGTPIAWNASVFITSDPDSSSGNGSLAWRSEGEAEWFLEELHDCNSTASAGCLPATFNIVYAPPADWVEIPLFCPLIWPPAHCEMYVLTSTPGTYTSGLASYVENGVTYITLGEEGTLGNLPILFIRPSSASAVTAKGGHHGQEAAVRMVV